MYVIEVQYYNRRGWVQRALDPARTEWVLTQVRDEATLSSTAAIATAFALAHAHPDFRPFVVRVMEAVR